MTIGTGIFLSAILLATAILFTVTKDRWNWKRIAKWGILTPIALVAILSAGAYSYDRWDSRARPQLSFDDVELGSVPADVKFIKGEPTSTDSPDRWIYNAGSGAAARDAAKYLIQFKDGRIRFILYTANETQIVTPYLLGFTMGARYQDIEEKLGPPSHIGKSADDLDRIFSYDKLNVFFSFKQGRVIAYGLYQPADGPMRFRNESAASAPNQ